MIKMSCFYSTPHGVLIAKPSSPNMKKLQKNSKRKIPKLRLAKIDGTQNEVESVILSGFPTVKFYPGNKKDQAPLDYNGDRSVEDIIKFIKNNAATPIVYEDKKKEEKKEEAKKEDGKTEEL